ncbi:MAG: ATP synthase F1 subunit gamma [Negativicutes bacterium]|nr:ATP synthase F1 subunit gamma [Negativicutes bacterium]
MASGRDILRRIRSVKNIQKITRAMKMVASARLRRAQDKAAASQPYIGKMREMLANVAAEARGNSPLLAEREVKCTAYVVVAADKGLAGAYSSNVIKFVRQRIQGRPADQIALFAVGRKVRDHFARRGYKLAGEFTGFSERPAYADAVRISRAVIDGFAGGKFDEIYLIYSHFRSIAHHEPTALRLLPVSTGELTGAGRDEDRSGGYLFEPSPEQVLEKLLPQYVQTMIYGGLLQAAASELGARMTAMNTATENAGELIETLTLNYNKIRQASITTELTEIVGGAEALK